MECHETLSFEAAAPRGPLWHLLKRISELDMPQTDKDAEDFLARGEQCLRLAEASRQIANELETIGNEFMARAVKADTDRQKSEKNGNGS